MMAALMRRDCPITSEMPPVLFLHCFPVSVYLIYRRMTSSACLPVRWRTAEHHASVRRPGEGAVNQPISIARESHDAQLLHIRLRYFYGITTSPVTL